MKLFILSDLHLETGPFSLDIPAGVDAIMLAGDICSPSHHSRLRGLLSETRGVPTFYIAGNHEFYGADYEQRLKQLHDLSGTFPNVRFLNNEPVVFNGHILFASTLWTDFTLYKDPRRSAEVARNSINDFFAIRYQGEPITTAWMSNHHAEAIAKLRSTISQHDAGESMPLIVMTHFVPHPKSIHEQYRGDSCNPYFCTDLSGLFGPPIKLWIHGHTHSSFNYDYNGTQVVCNPKGYGEENPGFDARLVVEVN
jgi:predicted phosphodiesterase